MTESHRNALEFTESVDGWSVVVPASSGAAPPGLGVLGCLLFASQMAMFVMLVVMSTLPWLTTLFLAALLGVVSAVLVNAALPSLLRPLQRTRLQVLQDSLRVERTCLGIQWSQHDLDLRSCGDVLCWGGVLRLPGLEVPVDPACELDPLVMRIRDGVALARARRDASPAVPKSLSALRRE